MVSLNPLKEIAMWHKESVCSNGASVFWKRCSMAAACLAMTAGSVAAFDVPRVWCWDTPSGDVLSRSEFVEMVRLELNGSYADPGVAAGAITAEIALRELDEDDICILLQNYGNT